jgi:hypothetical protein
MILKILAIPVSTQEAERHQKWLTFSNRIKSQPGSHRFLLSVNINIGEMGVGIKSTNAKYFLQFFLKSQRKIHYIET